MKDPSTNENSRAPHNGASTQSIPGADQTLATSSPTQTMPPRAQTPPPTQPVQRNHSGGGFRAGAILILALVLCSCSGLAYLLAGSSQKAARVAQAPCNLE